MDEFNKASAGYWRNWERNTAWLMRELAYPIIIGSPNIKESTKPHSPKEIYKISDDKEDKKIEPPTNEDIEAVRNVFKDELNGMV